MKKIKGSSYLTIDDNKEYFLSETDPFGNRSRLNLGYISKDKNQPGFLYLLVIFKLDPMTTVAGDTGDIIIRVKTKFEQNYLTSGTGTETSLTHTMTFNDTIIPLNEV